MGNMKTIIITGELDFEDTELKELFSKMQSKMDAINERTKSHTIQIQEIIKSMKGGKETK